MSQGASVHHLMFSVAEVSNMLKESLTLLEWVVARVPNAWHHRLPEGAVRGLRGDERSVAHHIAHLVLYEVKLATPVLRELARGQDGTAVAKSGSMSWLLPATLELSVLPIEELMIQLRQARAEQVEVVDSFDDARFNHPMTRLWGTGDGSKLETPAWVATKTVQHTGEHTNSVFRFTLFAP
jgi:hypothetical protein